MLPPTEASNVPDDIGMRIAIDASADVVKLFDIARTVFIVGKMSGTQIVNTMMIRTHT